MKKTRLNLLIVVLIASSLVLIGICRFGVAQSGINTSTIISTDTTWTQANSPYNIAGNVLINSGVTLTLAAGTTLNLNGYMVVTGSLIIQPGVTINIQNASGYIQVDGVLSAVGTNTNPIQINGTEGAPHIRCSVTRTITSITFGREQRMEIEILCRIHNRVRSAHLNNRNFLKRRTVIRRYLSKRPYNKRLVPNCYQRRFEVRNLCVGGAQLPFQATPYPRELL